MSYFQEGFLDHEPPPWLLRNLDDYSWHKDASPKWALHDGGHASYSLDDWDDDVPAVVVWVNHPDPFLREPHQDTEFSVDVLPRGMGIYEPVPGFSVNTNSAAEMSEAVVRGARHLGLDNVPPPLQRLMITMWQRVPGGGEETQLWPEEVEPGVAALNTGDLDAWFERYDSDLGLDQVNLDEIRTALTMTPQESGEKYGKYGGPTMLIVPGDEDGILLTATPVARGGGSAVKAALDAINRERARAGERPLDPVAAGWTDDDLLKEATRLEANPMSAAERKVLGAVLLANAQGRRAPRTKRNAAHMGTLQRAGHLVVNPTGAWVTSDTAKRIARGRL